MSHEGIRLVPAHEAARIDQEEAHSSRELPREMTDPRHVRVDKTNGTGMEIEWRDGHTSHWSFTWLRDACPCATCLEARRAEGRKPGQPIVQPVAVLPMYKPPVRPESAAPVGRYAISFHWNDGHQSGIFSWDYLRRHCQCGQCQAERS